MNCVFASNRTATLHEVGQDNFYFPKWTECSVVPQACTHLPLPISTLHLAILEENKLFSSCRNEQSSLSQCQLRKTFLQPLDSLYLGCCSHKHLYLLVQLDLEDPCEHGHMELVFFEPACNSEVLISLLKPLFTNKDTLGEYTGNILTV